MKLDDIGDARHPEREGLKVDTSTNEDITSALSPWRLFMYPVMKVATLEGERVVSPHLLDVDERALSLAEHQMLQRRKREKIIFVERLFLVPHGGGPSRRNCIHEQAATPALRAASSWPGSQISNGRHSR